MGRNEPQIERDTDAGRGDVNGGEPFLMSVGDDECVDEISEDLNAW